MALKFNKLEPIEFGDKKYQPTVSPETRRRIVLEMAQPSTAENDEVAIDTICHCFGDKSNEVKEFINANIGQNGIKTLQLYLTEGDKGLEALNKSIETATLAQLRSN